MRGRATGKSFPTLAAVSPLQNSERQFDRNLPPSTEIVSATCLLEVKDMRPTGVTVIGVIGIILGVFGLCGSLCGAAAAGMLPQIAEMAQQSGEQSAELKAMMENPAAMRFALVGSIVGVLLGLWLLIASTMLLGMKPVGYTLMMAYAVVSILWNIIGTGISFAVMGTEPNPIALISTIIGLIYPVAVLIVLTRPNIKEAFQSSF
jgi:hypothetical protein